MNERWLPIIHREICDGYLISSLGRIKAKDGEPYSPDYHSSNGYDYALFILKKEYRNKSMYRLFPVDELVGNAFINPDPELYESGKPLIIKHIDGDTRNNNVDNLEWIENVEEWRPLKLVVHSKDGSIARAQEGEYMVSSWGRVYSLKSNMPMKCNLDDGYLKVMIPLVIDGTGERVRKHTKLHRIMCMTFDVPNHDEDHNCINHINGIRSDNSLKNLEWESFAQNVRHAFLTGQEVNPKGEKHPRAKFTNHQRECIYEILKTLKYAPPKVLTKIIAERLPNISHDDVKYAKQVIRKTEGFEFPKLPNAVGPKESRIVLTEEQINEIRSQIYEIFDKYGIMKVEVFENEYKKNN